MNPRPFIISLLCLLITTITASAQDKNPYKSIGKKGKILTLSSGRYEELIEKDSLERLGTVIVNRYTRKIERLLNEDLSIEGAIKGTNQSRFLSVDPITNTFPEYSPYQYAGNTPIQAIDLDGLEEFVVIKELFRSGRARKITVQQTITKEDNNTRVNAHFRQVIGKNPNGTDKLGGFLTDQKVIRITYDANGKETSAADDNLTPQEQAIVDTRSRNEVENPTADHWDLTIGGKYYLSETERNTNKMTDQSATRSFRGNMPTFRGTGLAPGATLKNFEGSNDYFVGTGHFKGAGSLGNNLKAALNQLADQLLVADNVTSITLNINQGSPNSTKQQQDIATQHATTALNNAVSMLRKRLKGTSISVNAGTVNTNPNQSNKQLNTSGAAVGLNVTVQ